jgi:hypothetical protein
MHVSRHAPRMRPVHALGGDLEHVAFVAQVGRAAPQILVTIPRRLMIMAGGGDGPAFACLMAVRPHGIAWTLPVTCTGPPSWLIVL